MVHKGRSEVSQQSGIAGSLLVSQCRTCSRTCSLEPSAPGVPNFPPAPSGVGRNGFLDEIFCFCKFQVQKLSWVSTPSLNFVAQRIGTSALRWEETQNSPNLDTPNFWFYCYSQGFAGWSKNTLWKKNIWPGKKGFIVFLFLSVMGSMIAGHGIHKGSVLGGRKTHWELSKRFLNEGLNSLGSQNSYWPWCNMCKYVSHKKIVLPSKKRMDHLFIYWVFLNPTNTSFLSSSCSH